MKLLQFQTDQLLSLRRGRVSWAGGWRCPMIVLVSQCKGHLPGLGQKLVHSLSVSHCTGSLVYWCTPGWYHTGALVHWYTGALVSHCYTGTLQVGITPSCETLMCMFSRSTPATGKNAVWLFHFRYTILLHLYTKLS